MDNVTDISVGNYHGYAIKNGQLYSVGNNSYGQLGEMVLPIVLHLNCQLILVMLPKFLSVFSWLCHKQ